ncbi:MAG: hypothetical protein C5B47_02530 [Verrucomicrobia bacterium]|nr:MAG: hypothetical protein C5B47_02530 [Verrucomicrobiota bacterium]
MTISFSSIVSLVAVAVISSGTTFFITKSVCSNSKESQVVAYLKEKDARERAEAEKAAYPMGREAAKRADEQMCEARRKLREYRP